MSFSIKYNFEAKEANINTETKSYLIKPLIGYFSFEDYVWHWAFESNQLLEEGEPKYFMLDIREPKKCEKVRTLKLEQASGKIIKTSDVILTFPEFEQDLESGPEYTCIRSFEKAYPYCGPDKIIDISVNLESFENWLYYECEDLLGKLMERKS